MNLFILILFLSSLASAEVPSPPYPTQESLVVPEMVKPETSPNEDVVENADPSVEGPSPKVEEIESDMKTSTRDHRENSAGTVMVGYQLISSWLPSKKAISYTHIFNEKWSLEGEYSWSTVKDPLFWIDLGDIREERFNLQARRYVGNSFNFTFGFVYSELRAKLGSDFLDNFGNEIRSSFAAQNIGITGGIGNRWQWGNGFTLGVDWIRMNVPVVHTYIRDDVLDSISDNDEEDDVKDVIKTFNRLPTFVLLGLNIGYTF